MHACTLGSKRRHFLISTAMGHTGHTGHTIAAGPGRYSRHDVSPTLNVAQGYSSPNM